MDNNFYKILESFKRVNEGHMKDMLWDLSDRMDREQFINYTTSEMGFDADEMAEFWDNIHGPLDETFTGYWKGTDAGTPGKKMVGADESIEPTKVNPDGSWQQEGPWVKSTGKDPRGQVTHASDEARRTTSSLEDRLRARWEQTKKGLAEYGMTTGGTQNPTTDNATNPAAQAKDAIIAKTNLNKLSQMGINPSQATKAISNIETDPNKPLASVDLTQTKVLTDLVGDALSDPQKGSQLSTILQQVAKGK